MRRLFIEFLKALPAAVIAVIGYFYVADRKLSNDAYGAQLCLHAQVFAARGEFDRTNAREDRSTCLCALELLSNRYEPNGYEGLPATIVILRSYVETTHGSSIMRAVGELEEINEEISRLIRSGNGLEEERLGEQVEAIIVQAEEADGGLVAHFGVLPDSALPPADDGTIVPWIGILIVATAGTVAGTLLTSALGSAVGWLANRRKALQ
jgi:hypothetical protein